MPEPVSHVFAPLPPAVADAYIMVGHALRITMVNWLTDHPEALVSEIVEGIGSNRVQVLKQLKELETIGVVVPDTPAEQRQRRHVRYSINTEVVDQLSDDLAAFLRGSRQR